MIQPTFLFDDACPMCRAYTGAFKRCGWSDRLPLSAIDQEVLPHIDLDRSRHEIPLVDVRSGEVLYGLDAMTTVLAKAMPFMSSILRSKWLIAGLKPLYWLITYNRRIIAGTRPPATGYDCAPDVHRGWRAAWIGLALIVATLVGVPGAWSVLALFLLAFVLLARTKNRLDTLGHLSTALMLSGLVAGFVPVGWATLPFWIVMTGETWRRLG